MGRVTRQTHPTVASGFATPPHAYFVFGVGGQVMQNAAGRLAEAYTAVGPTVESDEGFITTPLFPALQQLASDIGWQTPEAVEMRPRGWQSRSANFQRQKTSPSAVRASRRRQRRSPSSE